MPVPRTVIHGTEVSAFGLLRLPLSPLVQLMQRRSPLGPLSIPFPRHHPFPLPLPHLGRAALKGFRCPQCFLYIVYITFLLLLTSLVDYLAQCFVPVVDLSGMSVPVRLFSPLAPVHLVSPLQLFQFQVELADYPDQAAAAYVLNGLRDGFRVGFETLSASLWSSSSNMRSTFDHPSVINAYLENEVSCGWVAGPFSSPPFRDLHISHFGVVPKNNQPGKWRLILAPFLSSKPQLTLLSMASWPEAVALYWKSLM